MGKLALKATTETTVTTEVKLKPQTRTMVLARAEEHASLATDIKGKKERQERIRGEISDLFRKDKQGKALLEGTKLAGFGLKFVEGHTSKFDKVGFMKKHGLSQEDFDEFTESVPKKGYVKVTAPGAKEDGDD